jgi:hypothetical protein
MKRMLTVIALAIIVTSIMAITASTVFADPNCTGPPGDRPASCLTSTRGNEEPGGGPPRPGNFVGPGGGSHTPNHR